MNSNVIEIPTSFRLGRHKYTVKWDDDYCTVQKQYGEADFDKREITLCRKYLDQHVPKSEILKSFYHELVHMILDSIGEDKLKYNEDLVDDLGWRLYQYHKSVKY